jgi:hypothetical protein
MSNHSQEDGLVVLGKGLGLPLLLARMLRLYGDHKRLVFCLNATGDEVRGQQQPLREKYNVH